MRLYPFCDNGCDSCDRHGPGEEGGVDRSVTPSGCDMGCDRAVTKTDLARMEGVKVRSSWEAASISLALMKSDSIMALHLTCRCSNGMQTASRGSVHEEQGLRLCVCAHVAA